MRVRTTAADARAAGSAEACATPASSDRRSVPIGSPGCTARTVLEGTLAASLRVQIAWPPSVRAAQARARRRRRSPRVRKLMDPFDRAAPLTTRWFTFPAAVAATIGIAAVYIYGTWMGEASM